MSKYIILFLIALLVIGSIGGYIKINSLENDLINTQNKDANVVKIRVPIPADTTLLAQQARLLNKLTTENESLKKYLKSTNSELKSQTDLVGVLSSKLTELGRINTTDSVSTDSVIKYFSYEDSLRTLKGNFYIIDPYTIQFTEDLYKIKLSISLVEGKSGVWEAFVDTKLTPGLKILDLSTNIKKLDSSWKDDLYFLVSGYTELSGMAGIEVGLNFFQHRVSYGFNNRDTYLKYSYTKIWRPFK